MIQFKTNTTYQARSACDHECIFEMEVIKRTAKTVTIKTRMDGIQRKKIFIGNDVEYIRDGNYSMAPIFRADKEKTEPEPEKNTSNEVLSNVSIDLESSDKLTDLKVFLIHILSDRVRGAIQGDSFVCTDCFDIGCILSDDTTHLKNCHCEKGNRVLNELHKYVLK